MLTTGEKIILGFTGLFLAGLCLFTALTSTDNSAPEPATTVVAPQTELTQEEILQEAVPTNINTATFDDLTQLPGIGDTLAQRILDHLALNGPFATLEDITNVSGIGQATLEGLRDYATVE